jgi:DNA invertase Pin-like site-specific DNA recombinase
MEQNIDRQEDNTMKSYVDKCSGSIAFKERKEASKLLLNEDIKEVQVHSIDRLGRNTLDIMNTIEGFTSRGINVVSVKEGLNTIVDGKVNPIAKLMIGILGTLSEFELTRIKERQLEGISKAKAKGVYGGRARGTKESVEVFMSKASTKSILKYLKMNESISRTAKLSQTSEGSVKKVKKMVKDGLIEL